MTVDMQEIVTCCNVDCLIVEQILFKKKKRGESSASAECNAWGKQMCMVVCSERNVLSWLCPPNSWQPVQAEGPRM